MKKKSSSPTEAERIATKNEQDMKEIEKRIAIGAIPANPTRLFKVGDPVKIGALENVVITKVLFDGMAYAIHYDYMGESYGRPHRKVGDGIWEWTEVFPEHSFGKGVPMCTQDDIRIDFFNCDINSLLHMAYRGVDFNPSYQRDLVWTMEQKTALIESIFNNFDIGKFTFVVRNYTPDRVFYYEILDGKQRLSTILEFYEDRLAWRGKKFTELCYEDAHHFIGYQIVQGQVREATEQQIYKLFVKMNTSGAPVSKQHLDKIKALITE